MYVRGVSSARRRRLVCLVCVGRKKFKMREMPKKDEKMFHAFKS